VERQGAGARRDVVVVGGSAGSIQALQALAAGLPPDLPAAVFVVVHVPPYAVSRLPEILARTGPLPAAHAIDGEPIAAGRIYVAPPDRHLLVRGGAVAVSRGPRENHARPAIDPLFRSAARAFGPRVVGVVLSGALYDGSMGLLAIKTRGGLAVVQDPDEAMVDSMPRNAMRRVAPDFVLPAAEIPALLATVVGERVGADARSGGMTMADDEARMDAVIAEDFAVQAHNARGEHLTVYTCPDCGGAIWQDGDALRPQFRCHVGHRFAPEVMLGLKSEELESALWSSLRLLKEKGTLTRQLAERTRLAGNREAAARIAEQADLDERHATAIQELLEAMPNPADRAAAVVQVLEADA
jgi:two-component system, chemotaxis family, protein-glutamate methylesterase/glutaminase